MPVESGVDHSAITLATLRGGYNDTDPPHSLRPDECTQADDVEFFLSECGERRAGTSTYNISGSGLTTGTTQICHISQWHATNDAVLTEKIFIAVNPGSTTVAARQDTGGTYHALTPNDAIVNTAPTVYQINTQALNGKLFIAYNSGVDRMHVWDGTNWRRSGLGVPGAPTAADSVTAGTFSGQRYYRVRAAVISGGVTLLKSEPGPVLTFTPANTKNGAVVTKPVSMPGEGETHWILEASLDNANFYVLATTVVGTTTFTDQTASPKTYPTPSHAAPTSTDGTSITYVLLSNQAAQLNLTGTVSNGTYSDGTNIAGRGWIGYDNSAAYIPLTPSLVWAANQTWYASPDVAQVLEQNSVGGTGQDYAHSGSLSDAIGAYLNIPSARYIAVDGDRLIFGGHWTNTALMSQVGWTPVTGDPGAGNSERAPIVTTGGTAITTTNQLDNYDNGPLTGLAATTFGSWYGFKWQGIYNAVRTNNVSLEYDIQKVNGTRGAIPGSVVKGADANGVGIIFFLDPFVGPCALLAGGVVREIRGLRNTWKSINTKATSVICTGTWYPRKQQVIWLIATNGGNSPNLGIKLQTSSLTERPDGRLGGGWSFIRTGNLANSFCMASLTVTVGNLTTDIPFVGQASPNWVQQTDSGTDDNGTAFTGTIVSAPRYPVGILDKWGTMNVSAIVTADSLGSIQFQLVRDNGVETSAGRAVSCAPGGSETQVFIDLDDLFMSEARCIAVLITDGTAGHNWQAQRVDLSPRSEDEAGS